MILKIWGILFIEELKCLLVNFCKNGGVCIEDLSGYNCNCKDGYNGINCEGINLIWERKIFK